MISSMTGFASQKGSALINQRQFDWVWEIKSVNGKSFDLKSRLPFGYESLTADLKENAAKFLNRGSVQVVLDLKSQSDAGLSDEDDALLRQQLLVSFAAVCEKLAQDRQAEGAKIKTALENILRQIAQTASKIADIAGTLPAKMRDKLAEQVKQWSDGVDVSEDRLAQELVLYVTRADIREEVDRLQAHIKTAEDLLNADGAVGRRLDFLCQELNREANTTCSKSCDIALTNLGMELKALVEQFREQVQNIE